eukprot:tig00000042_g15417.t2
MAAQPAMPNANPGGADAPPRLPVSHIAAFYVHRCPVQLLRSAQGQQGQIGAGEAVPAEELNVYLQAGNAYEREVVDELRRGGARVLDPPYGRPAGDQDPAMGFLRDFCEGRLARQPCWLAQARFRMADEDQAAFLRWPAADEHELAALVGALGLGGAPAPGPAPGGAAPPPFRIRPFVLDLLGVRPAPCGRAGCGCAAGRWRACLRVVDVKNSQLPKLHQQLQVAMYVAVLRRVLSRRRLPFNVHVSGLGEIWARDRSGAEFNAGDLWALVGPRLIADAADALREAAPGGGGGGGGARRRELAAGRVTSLDDLAAAAAEAAGEEGPPTGPVGALRDELGDRGLALRIAACVEERTIPTGAASLRLPRFEPHFPYRTPLPAPRRAASSLSFDAVLAVAAARRPGDSALCAFAVRVEGPAGNEIFAASWPPASAPAAPPGRIDCEGVPSRLASALEAALGAAAGAGPAHAPLPSSSSKGGAGAGAGAGGYGCGSVTVLAHEAGEWDAVRDALWGEAALGMALFAFPEPCVAACPARVLRALGGPAPAGPVSGPHAVQALWEGNAAEAARRVARRAAAACGVLRAARAALAARYPPGRGLEFVLPLERPPPPLPRERAAPGGPAASAAYLDALEWAAGREDLRGRRAHLAASSAILSASASAAPAESTPPRAPAPLPAAALAAGAAAVGVATGAPGELRLLAAKPALGEEDFVCLHAVVLRPAGEQPAKALKASKASNAPAPPFEGPDGTLLQRMAPLVLCAVPGGERSPSPPAASTLPALSIEWVSLASGSRSPDRVRVGTHAGFYTAPARLEAGALYLLCDDATDVLRPRAAAHARGLAPLGPSSVLSGLRAWAAAAAAADRPGLLPAAPPDNAGAILATAARLGLEDAHLSALERFLSQRTHIVQGPPGTGKTYFIGRVLLAIVHAYLDAKSAFKSPAGKGKKAAAAAAAPDPPAPPRILVVAHTNTCTGGRAALDNVCEAVGKARAAYDEAAGAGPNSAAPRVLQSMFTRLCAGSKSAMTPERIPPRPWARFLRTRLAPLSGRLAASPPAAEPRPAPPRLLSLDSKKPPKSHLGPPFKVRAARQIRSLAQPSLEA